MATSAAVVDHQQFTPPDSCKTGVEQLRAWRQGTERHSAEVLQLAEWLVINHGTKLGDEGTGVTFPPHLPAPNSRVSDET